MPRLRPGRAPTSPRALARRLESEGRRAQTCTPAAFARRTTASKPRGPVDGSGRRPTPQPSSHTPTGTPMSLTSMLFKAPSAPARPAKQSAKARSSGRPQELARIADRPEVGPIRRQYSRRRVEDCRAAVSARTRTSPRAPGTVLPTPKAVGPRPAPGGLRRVAASPHRRARRAAPPNPSAFAAQHRRPIQGETMSIEGGVCAKPHGPTVELPRGVDSRAVTTRRAGVTASSTCRHHRLGGRPPNSAGHPVRVCGCAKRAGRPPLSVGNGDSPESRALTGHASGSALRGVRSSETPAHGARLPRRAAMDTATWYVLLTSQSGNTCFATLGPYTTRELAEAKATESNAAHYRVEESATHPTPISGRG